MTFWSSKIRFGVPARVIGSGFDDGGRGGVGLLWGVGASGNELEVAVATLTGSSCGMAIWAEQSWPVATRRVVVRQREALNLGCFTGIGKFGRQHSATPC